MPSPSSTRALCAPCFFLLLACGGPGAPAAANERPLPIGNVDAAAATTPNNAVYPSEADLPVPVTSQDPTVGDRTAPVTIVFFGDVFSPPCSDAMHALERLRAELGNDKIRIVWKSAAGEGQSELVAEIGQAVFELAGAAAFWRYVEKASALASERRLSAEAARALAVTQGADERRLVEGLESKRWSKKVAYDVDLTELVGATLTGSVVNGVRVSSSTYQALKSLVDAELAETAAMARRGIPREKIYAERVHANIPSAQDPLRAFKTDPEFQRQRDVPVAGAPIDGPATAPVTIVEFVDLDDGLSAVGHVQLRRLRSEYGDRVRIVWHDAPAPPRQWGAAGAELARAARAQRGDAAFWDVVDRLAVHPYILDDATIERIAAETTLDGKGAILALKTHKFKTQVDADVTVAQQLGLRRSELFINGHRVTGPGSYLKYKAIVDEELAKAARSKG